MEDIRKKKVVTKALQIAFPSGIVLTMVANGVDITTPYSIRSADWKSYMEAINDFSAIGQAAIKKTADRASFDVEMKYPGNRSEI